MAGQEGSDIQDMIYCDLLGNVAEWVADLYHENYNQRPTTSAPWAKIAIDGCDEDTIGVVRGGSWENTASELRSTDRNAVITTSRSRSIGFRIARSSN